MKSIADVRSEDYDDPEMRDVLARTRFANALAILVLEYRVAQGLSVPALARRIGITPKAVARLEDGEHDPSIGLLVRLTALLGPLRILVTPRGAEMLEVAPYLATSWTPTGQP